MKYLFRFLPIDMGATEGFMKAQIEQLEEENKKLKERVSELEDVSKDYDLLSKDFIALGEENKILKERIEALELCIDVD